ncbi:MAG TPA: GNAT family N-acetyltransferase [Steroidobacteraceae bacterium]|jgi:L-amino acid N-acyltransferase
MSVHIISCDRSRAGAVLAILNEAIEHSTALYDYQARTPAMMEAWYDAKEKARYPVIGVVDDANVLLGFGSFGPFRAWPAYKYTAEHSLYVERAHRGQGIGKLLLAELVAAAMRQDYHTLIGGIDADNAASIALHRRLGFEQCAHIRQAGFKFNRWLDLKFYQLVLDTPAYPIDG